MVPKGAVTTGMATRCMVTKGTAPKGTVPKGNAIGATWLQAQALRAKLVHLEERNALLEVRVDTPPPLAWFPCLSSSKHPVVCMEKVEHDLMKLVHLEERNALLEASASQLDLDFTPIQFVWC